MESLDVNAAIWSLFCVRHSSSRSSSWKRLFREFTFHQESVYTIIETVVSGKLITDQIEITSIPVIGWQQQQMWQRTTPPTVKAVQFATAKTSFPIQCCVWEASVQIPSEHGRTRLSGSWHHVNLDNWIESTGSRWSSSGIFLRIHYTRDPR